MLPPLARTPASGSPEPWRDRKAHARAPTLWAQPRPQTEWSEPVLQAELLHDPRADPRAEVKRLSKELCVTYAELLG